MKTKEDLINTEIEQLKSQISELEKLNTQQQNLYVNGNTVIFLWNNDSGWTVDYVSENIRRLLGYEVTDFLSGKINYADIIYPDDKERVLAEVTEAVSRKKGHFEHLDYRIFDADGNLHWIYDFTTIIYDNQKNVTHFYGYILDISRRKTAEHRLALSEKRFRTVFENATIGYYRTSPDGDIMMANPMLLKILEYNDLQELTQHNVAIGYANPADRRKFRELIETQGVVSGYESVWRTKNGNHIFVREYASVVRDEQNRTLFYEGTVEDISIQKHYEAELLEAKEKAVRADKLKSAFLANMSHEIRTPLNGILGFAQLLSDEELQTETRKYYIEIINKSGEQLLRIISDVLDMSKIEVGELTIKKTNFSLKTLLNDIYLTFHRSAEVKGLFFRLETEGFETNEDTVFSDEHRLKQIYMNLIHNALKFTETGLITFGTKKEETFLSCFVQDTGIGIPLEKQERIFERYGNADSEHAIKYGGAGLGLSICKGITELLGGNIYYDSTYISGARFIFQIPIEQKKKY